MWRMFCHSAGRRSGAYVILRKLRKDETGTTAIEFAMVATPFLMMLYGIISLGLYFFSTFTLENAIEVASRQIRTGQAQAAGLTQAQFQQVVFNNVPSFINQGNLIVNVNSFATYAAITPASCVDVNGAPTAGSTSFAPGTQSAIVVAWVCYTWDVTKYIPFLKLGNLPDGSRLIQATTTFQTEPYQ